MCGYIGHALDCLARIALGSNLSKLQTDAYLKYLEINRWKSQV